MGESQENCLRMRLHIIVLVTATLMHGCGAQNIIAQWLRNVGIKYVPPPPREGTCRDCSKSSQARFGFDITPTQATNPCCPETTPTPTPTACKCGEEGGSRIVGGQDSSNGKYPWIVSLNFNSNTGANPGGCAGTLVAAQWVVTAAHCIKGVCNGADCTMSTLSVVLGEFDLSSSSDSFDTYRKNVKLAMNPIVHESYQSPKTSSNDIALLKLAESVDTTRYVPACLPAVNMDYTGQTGRVYGWGSTASCPPSASNILQEVEVPIVTDAVCEAASSSSVTSSNGAGGCITQALSYAGQISGDMVCAGAPGKDSCQGDSGGPLTVKSSSTSQHDLVGVVSWGYGCAADGLYGVYSEVARLRTWIDTNIAANGGATYCPSRYGY